MSQITRCGVRVNSLKDPKDALELALAKLKRKMKDSDTFTDYLNSLVYVKPSDKRRIKRKLAASRNRYRERS